MITKKLNDLCVSITDCPHSTPKWTSEGKLVIRNQYIKNGKLDLTNPSFTDEESFIKRRNRAKPSTGDIIITREAPMGEVCIVPGNLECCLGQRMVLLKVNDAVCDNRYLLYTLMSRTVQNQISWSNGTGTTVSNLRIPHLENIDIPFIPLNEQRSIAATLSCLDDKIELNNKINANLEAQAQAIFKSWFVDFEPFQDGEFVDSKLGPIPKGWQVGSLADIGTIVGGSTPSKAKEEYYALSEQGIPWITPKDLSTNKNKYIYHGEVDITDIGYKNSSTRIMPEGSVLFSSRAPIGYIAIAANELCTNQGFKSVVPNENIGTEFIYYTLKANLETIQNLGSGSTFKEVSGSVMKNVPVLIPSFTSIKEFSAIVSTLTAQQKVLESQSQTLVGLRDSLLPKLMSGEVEIPEKG